MLLTTRYPKFAAKYICAVGLLICFAQYTWARPPSPTPTPTPPCATPTPTSTPTSQVDVNIVAHQDDDILFMNPDILNSVVAGHRQVTVYITAGNVAESETAYAMAREEGAIAGYQKLLQLADAIQADAHHFDDFNAVSPSPTPVQSFNTGDSRYPVSCAAPTPHCFACAEHADELSTPGTASVVRQTLPIGSRCFDVANIGDGKVLLIFLRVQTPCNVFGNALCPTRIDLADLFTSGDSQLHIGSTFDQPGYTKQQLINQLVDILRFVQPDVVRTQDTADGVDVDRPGDYQIANLGCDGGTNEYDHSDHVWGARFANEAVRSYNRLPNVKSPTYFNYKGYNLEWNETPATRVSTKDFCLKKSITYRYALHDYYIIFDTGEGCTDPDFNQTQFCRDEYAIPFDCFFYICIGYQKGQQKKLH